MDDFDYRTGGLRQEYIITKADGSPVDPKAKYFVLRYDSDPHARRALDAYALSVRKDNPRLANDLIHALLGTSPK